MFIFSKSQLQISFAVAQHCCTLFYICKWVPNFAPIFHFVPDDCIGETNCFWQRTRLCAQRCPFPNGNQISIWKRFIRHTTEKTPVTAASRDTKTAFMLEDTAIDTAGDTWKQMLAIQNQPTSLVAIVIIMHGVLLTSPPLIT